MVSVGHARCHASNMAHVCVCVCVLVRISAVDLLERPLVVEARVPDLVDDLDGVHVVLARRPRHEGLDGAHPDAVLELLRQRPVAARKRLSCPSALAAEHGRADLPYRVLAWLSALGRGEEREKERERERE